MVLICGGAGYIGSHMLAYLNEQGVSAVVVDNLATGHRAAVDAADAKTPFYQGDLRDSEFLDKVFSENKIEAVINFAAFSLVGESVSEPLKYFDNNVCGTISLMNAMKKHGVKYIVFSSTAAVYGEAENIPIKESEKINPKSPYGLSKRMIESILHDCDKAYGIKYCVLRYFNVAGAHPSGNIGEHHEPESHLIPLIAQTALGQRDELTIFGDDYATADGTCIRDYIHVMDLVAAHALALKHLQNGSESKIYNLGNGDGFSVKEVINAFERVTGIEINKKIGARRAGDPAVLISSSELAINELGWQPKFDSLEKIIETAWHWHKNNPSGYEM